MFVLVVCGLFENLVALLSSNYDLITEF